MEAISSLLFVNTRVDHWQQKHNHKSTSFSDQNEPFYSEHKINRMKNHWNNRILEVKVLFFIGSLFHLEVFDPDIK